MQMNLFYIAEFEPAIRIESRMFPGERGYMGTRAILIPFTKSGKYCILTPRDKHLPMINLLLPLQRLHTLSSNFVQTFNHIMLACILIFRSRRAMITKLCG